MKTPATPLPWRATKKAVMPKVFGPECGLYRSSEQVAAPGNEKDAAYIAHAANAYPKLIEALRHCIRVSPLRDTPADDEAEALLRDLGELA